MSRNRLKQMADVVMCGNDALFSGCVEHVVQWMLCK